MPFARGRELSRPLAMLANPGDRMKSSDRMSQGETAISVPISIQENSDALSFSQVRNYENILKFNLPTICPTQYYTVVLAMWQPADVGVGVVDMAQFIHRLQKNRQVYFTIAFCVHYQCPVLPWNSISWKLSSFLSLVMQSCGGYCCKVLISRTQQPSSPGLNATPLDHCHHETLSYWKKHVVDKLTSEFCRKIRESSAIAVKRFFYFRVLSALPPLGHCLPFISSTDRVVNRNRWTLFLFTVTSKLLLHQQF